MAGSVIVVVVLISIIFAAMALLGLQTERTV